MSSISLIKSITHTQNCADTRHRARARAHTVPHRCHEWNITNSRISTETLAFGVLAYAKCQARACAHASYHTSEFKTIITKITPAAAHRFCMNFIYLRISLGKQYHALTKPSPPRCYTLKRTDISGKLNDCWRNLARHYDSLIFYHINPNHIFAVNLIAVLTISLFPLT